MKESSRTVFAASPADGEVSFFRIASHLLRWRYAILLAGLFGAVSGVMFAVIQHKYESAVVFLPQSSDAMASSALALAATQLGIRSGSASGNWTPAIYADVIVSRGFLESLAVDTVVVAEMGNRPVAMMDLMEIPPLPPDRRLSRAVKSLRGMVEAIEDKRLNVVRLTVRTKWPSVSYALAQRLIKDVNLFNISTRQSQASSERKHVEAQTSLAEASLRNAEGNLQRFLEGNRRYTESPNLGFQHDRLQREVTLRQTLYTNLLQQRDEVRIREVRDIPVLTILQDANLPVVGEGRGRLMWALTGGTLFAVFAIMVLSLRHFFVTRIQPSEADDVREFLGAFEASTPQWLRRKIM